MLGHRGVPAQFVRNALAQDVGGLHFAMYHKDLFGGVGHAAHPGQGLSGVGMG